MKLDRDLAEMYAVETRVLNQAVRRNLKRFPSDLIFQLNDEEFQNLKSNLVISALIKGSNPRISIGYIHLNKTESSARNTEKTALKSLHWH